LRREAAEARECAEGARFPEIKSNYLEIAKSYERMASSIEEIALTLPR